jgi:hypothetical protein
MAAGFYIAVEDDLGDAVARRLLDHVRRRFEVRARYPLRVLPHEKPQLTGFGYLRANIAAFTKAAMVNPHLLLTDLDVATCAPELIRKWIGGTPHPNFLFRVAVREVEAWLLADTNNFADFLSLAPKHLPASIEAVAHPKEEIVKLAALSPNPEVRDNLAPRAGSTATTGPLFTRSLIRYVRDLWDIEAAAGKADSLHRALKALRSFKPA